MPKVLVPKETRAGETRVAATPETVKKLVKAGLEVAFEAGAGAAAGFADAQYTEAGATVAAPGPAAWQAVDVVVAVQAPAAEQAALLKPGAVLIALLAPYKNLELARAMAAAGTTSLAMELVPRITRAQTMDALSSQASIAGYKAALVAASRLPKYFPLLMTAAGTIAPAKVVVMGAGVAGLQALATAKRLGAVVEVSDIREVVKEQVLSLGGRFIELPKIESGEGAGGYAKEMTPEFLAKQREIVARHVAAADVVITTALVPGKPAPKLVSREMVESMHAGAVIVDLAIEQGGNCEVSRADEEVVHQGVLVLAPSNLAATLAADASLLYSRNVLALLLHCVKNGALSLDPNDEILSETLLTHDGRVVHAGVARLLDGASAR